MSDSSQRPDYSTIWINDQEVKLDSWTDMSSISINSNITNSIGTITIDSSFGTTSDYTFNDIRWSSEEWIDSFPDWNRIQDMRKKYPSLEIAMRNLQTIYTLVKDDYDNPKDKE